MEQIKLDIGCGTTPRPGYIGVDRHFGSEAYPLAYEDESVDEIIASHVLEHFSMTLTVDVVREWVRVLKPGGVLKVAVPNFKWIAENYLAGREIPVQGYVMGGQTDENDYHKAIFDDECLSEALRLAGLIDIQNWTSDIQDCASLEVSLNMMGTKPRKLHDAGQLKISAVMSVPRLGFMDNFFAAFEALSPMGIILRRHMGAYWEACLERTMTATIEEDKPDLILTLDYDSVFTRSDVEKQLKIMQERPEVDALAAVQSARFGSQPLMTLDLPLGVQSNERIPHGVFQDDITELRTAHFGLTMIRVSSLQKLPKPWLWSQPAPDKTWGEGRVDADVYFWKQWKEAGLRVFSANRVVIGHMELMVLWPGENFTTITQLPKEFNELGKPKGIWK